jgi:PAS domain S-box-containing protein
VKQNRRLDFEAVFNSLPTPFLVMDRDFNIVAFNRAFLNSTTRSHDALIGTNIFTAFPAADESSRVLQDSLERVRDNGVVNVLPVFSCACADNGRTEERLWSCTHVPVHGKDGQVEFLLETAQDISELHPLKGLAGLDSAAADETDPQAGSVQVLSESVLATVQHLGRLVMQAPSFMCVLRGPKLIFELVNTAFSMLAGGRELIGKTLLEGLPETEGQDYPRILENIFKTGEVHVGRSTRILLKDIPR